MPVRRWQWARRLPIATAMLIFAFAVWDALQHTAMAQNPFGAAQTGAAAGGLVSWILTQQAAFYRELSAAIRASTADGSAAWKVLGISFAYGVFHAAGPGHGKAVITSYLISNGETARRGVLLSFLTALLQAFVAVIIVGVGAWLLDATARSLCGTERLVEIASYLLIAAFGAWMLWIKGAGLVRLARAVPVKASDQTGAFRCVESSSAARMACDCGPAVLRSHRHDPDCGHSHGPAPESLAGRDGWRRGIVATAAAGLRPCSGAILLLVFALAQGVFWLGVAGVIAMGLGTAVTVTVIAVATLLARDWVRRAIRLRGSAVALWRRGLEAAAAALVMLLGVGLLMGYVAAERVTCF